MHWLGMGLCHQLPARSFFGGGHQLPVCARDTGIYLGFVISLAVISALDRGRHRDRMPPAWLLAVGAVLVAVLGWDGVTEYAGLRTTTNVIRLATGLGTGFALALVVVPILNSQLWSRRSSERVLGSPWDGAAWLGALVVSFPVVYFGGPAIGIAYPVVAALCILATFTGVNLVVVALVPAFEHKAAHLRDTWRPVAIALAVSIAELAAADALRLVLLRLVGRG